MFKDTGKRAQLVSFFIVKMKLAMTHESQIMNAGFFISNTFISSARMTLAKS